MSSDWEPEPIDDLNPRQQSGDLKEDKQLHHRQYYYHHDNSNNTEYHHQHNQQLFDRHQNDNSLNHNYNHSPHNHDPYSQYNTSHNEHNDNNATKVSYDEQYDTNQRPFLSTNINNSYQYTSNYHNGTDERTSTSRSHTNGEKRRHFEVTETQCSAVDSGVTNSQDFSFVTTPLIMQVLNDEKMRLAASIRRTKEEAAATQSGEGNTLNENDSRNGGLGKIWTKSRKLSTLLRTDPRLVSFMGMMPEIHSTLSFGDHFEKYREDAEKAGDGARPGVDGFPGRKDLERFLKRGHEVDKNGLYPIHEACLKYPHNAKLIGMMIRSTPKCTGYQVRRMTNQNLGHKSFSDPVIVESNSRQPLKKRKSEGLLILPDRFSSGGKEERQEGGSRQVKDNHDHLIGMYPMHICIANSASIEVMKLLARANPKALSSPDANGMVPLSLAFRYHRSVETEYFNEMVHLLLAANSSAAKVLDARSNSSLHYACMTYIQAGGLRWRPRSGSLSTNSITESSSSSAAGLLLSSTESQAKIASSLRNSNAERDRIMSVDNSHNSKMESKSMSTSSSRPNSNRVIPFEILKMLTEANPNAIHIRNFNGHTPLDLAESSGEVDDISITFLQNIAYGVEEDVEEPPLNLF